MFIATGITGTIVPIFIAKVIKKQSAELEDSEAIEEILALSINEIKQAFVKGYYLCNIRGKEKQIPFRDPFLAYAVMMYELKEQNQSCTK